MKKLPEVIGWAKGLVESKAGFWTIVSTLVAASTAGSAYLENYFVERTRVQNQIQTLTLEAEYRISQYFVALARITQHDAQKWKFAPSYDVSDAIAMTRILAGTPSTHRNLSIYSYVPKEFADRSLASLYVGLVLLDSKNGHIYKRRSAFVNLHLLGNKVDNIEDVQLLAQSIQQELVAGKRITNMPYMTCPAVEPLCEAGRQLPKGL